MKDLDTNGSPMLKKVVSTYDWVVRLGKIHENRHTYWNVRNRMINDPGRSNKAKKLITLLEVS